MKCFSTWLEKHRFETLMIPCPGDDLEQWELSCTTDSNVKGDTTLGNNLAVPYKMNVYLPSGPGSTLLGVCPRKKEMPVQAETCTWGFIVALFVTPTNENSSNVLEWRNKLRHLHTAACHSTTQQQKRIFTPGVTRVSHKITLTGGQTRESTCCMSPCV